MSLTRQIAHNSLMQIIGKVISTFLGIIVIALLTRYLGKEGYGQYTTILAFLQFFGVLVDMGLYIILIKKISEPKIDDSEIVSNIFTLRLISAIIFLGLAPVVVLFFPYPEIIKTGVALTTFSVFFITLNQVLMGVFQKNLRMDKPAISEVLGRIALLIFVFITIKLGWGLLSVMTAVVIGSGINFLFTFFFVRHLVKITFRFNFDVWKKIIAESWPIAISIAFNLIYFKADTIILSLYKPQADVGIYGAPYKVLEVLTTFPAMFVGLVLPLLTNAYVEKNKARFKGILQKSFDTLSILAIPMAVGTYFLADRIMVLIAGEEFGASGAPLKILIFGAAIIFLGVLFGDTVVAIGKQKPMIFVYLSVAIISLIGYLIFIPRYSYMGAAVMTLISEALITIGAALMVLLTVKEMISFKIFLKSALASLIMAFSLQLLAGKNLFLLIGVALVVYIAVLYLIKGISRDTVREIIRLRN